MQALESNGLRVLVRLGFGEDRKSYAATYKSVREATLEELPGRLLLHSRDPERPLEIGGSHPAPSDGV